VSEVRHRCRPGGGVHLRGVAGQEGGGGEPVEGQPAAAAFGRLGAHLRQVCWQGRNDASVATGASDARKVLKKDEQEGQMRHLMLLRSAASLCVRHHDKHRLCDM
jgi:hypothetical protein